MKYGNRVDANQEAIVKSLRKACLSVAIIAPCGNGIPDLIVGWRGHNYLIEIKVGNAKLTPCEKTWHSEWKGSVAICKDAYDVFEHIANQEKKCSP